jgi:hypothetical protein
MSGLLYFNIGFPQILDGFQPFPGAHAPIIFIVEPFGFNEGLGFMNPDFLLHRQPSSFRKLFNYTGNAVG